MNVLRFVGENVALKTAFAVAGVLGASACTGSEAPTFVPSTVKGTVECQAKGPWKEIPANTLNTALFAGSLGVPQENVAGGRRSPAMCAEPIRADEAGHYVVRVPEPPEEMAGDCLVIGIDPIDGVVPPANSAVSVLCPLTSTIGPK